MVDSNAMIATTTSNSTSVNPLRFGMVSLYEVPGHMASPRFLCYTEHCALQSAFLGRGQVVRHMVLVHAFGGSNPSAPAKFSNRGEKCTFLCVFLFSPFHHLCYLGFESLEPDITTAVSLIVVFNADSDSVFLTLLKNSRIIILRRSFPYERL